MLKPNETQAIQQLELPFGACKLLVVLQGCKPAEDGKIEAPRAYFAERIGVHVSTISRYTRKLAEQGYIHIDKAERVGKPNRYTLLPKPQKVEAVKESHLEPRNRSLGSCPLIVGKAIERLRNKLQVTAPCNF